MNPVKPSSSPLASSSTSGSSWFSGIVRGRKSNTSAMANKSAIAALGGGDTLGPINRKNQFRGVMFKYGSKPIQVAFKTGDYKQHVVFIGGLTDGFLATAKQITLVQT